MPLFFYFLFKMNIFVKIHAETDYSDSFCSAMDTSEHFLLNLIGSRWGLATVFKFQTQRFAASLKTINSKFA